MKQLLLIVPLAVACGDHAPELHEQPAIIEPHVQQAARIEQREEPTKPGYLGVLVPRGLAEVVAPFSSTVLKLEVKLGDSVRRGQRLALLDERPLRHELDIANALYKASRAAAAEADVERRSARATREREQHAFDQGVSSKAELISAEFNQRKAEMSLARAHANVEEQRARIAKLTARLHDAVVTAPIDGRVSMLYVRDGDHVDEGRAVVRVISSDELFVKFAIPSAKAGTFGAGDPVDVQIEGQPVAIAGVVRHVGPEIDPIAKMILAEVELNSSPLSAQAGTDCRVIPRQL